MRTWIFAQNPILHATEDSFQKALAISTFHDSALYAAKDDPDCLVMYNTYHVFHLTLKEILGKWVLQGGYQQGDTLSVTQLLELLAGTKIQDWDIAIQGKHKQNTPEYKKILPYKRGPFQSGTKANRIQAVKNLSEAIGTDASLASVKTEIDGFYTMLNAAQSGQSVSIRISQSLVDQLEAARIAMCIAQYANLGALIKKYAATPQLIEKFFDLANIRSSHQAIFTGHVEAGQVYTIVKHTFGIADQVLLKNPGRATLKFYLAKVKDAQPGTQGVTLIATGQETVLASTLGSLTDTYLVVINTDTTQTGQFEIEIL